nr:MAG TPA_asm: hypothetical protein [Caudoviricetes sp.]
MFDLQVYYNLLLVECQLLKVDYFRSYVDFFLLLVYDSDIKIRREQHHGNQ